MSTFSGRKNSGMEIPDYAIERIARCLLPMIQAYYESDEGQAELAVFYPLRFCISTTYIITPRSPVLSDFLRIFVL